MTDQTSGIKRRGFLGTAIGALAAYAGNLVASKEALADPPSCEITGSYEGCFVVVGPCYNPAPGDWVQLNVYGIPPSQYCCEGNQEPEDYIGLSYTIESLATCS
jgi:hypothetical protein